MLRSPWLLLIALAPLACGGGDDDKPPPTTNTGRTTAVYSFQSSDLCAAKVPVPNDVFRDDDGFSEATCTSGSDPVDAAIARALSDEGAPLDAPIEVPLSADDGVDAGSLGANVAFSLTSSVGITGNAIPAILLLQRTGLSTAAAGWTILPHSASYSSAKTALEIVPSRALENDAYYVLVVTDAAQSSSKKALSPSPATTALTGVGNVVAGAYSGLDADGAAKLERERKRLADITSILERAHPPIARNEIVSIQGWTSAIGSARLEKAIARYQNAVARGRFPFGVTTTGGDLAPADVFPGATPAQFYSRINAFRRGTIKVPKLLDANGRLRRGWATTAVETEDLPFLIQIPKNAATYPVIVALPGWGRSKLDAREISRADMRGVGGVAAEGVAVLALDLPGHGDRTVDPATGALDTADTMPNNDNREFAAADGIPDRSGAGFLRGDPQAIRDGFIAATIEVLHVIETLKDGDAFVAQAINPQQGQIHLLAHGHSAAVGVYAGAFSTSIRTIQLPAGGVGVRELIAQAPQKVKESFLVSSPIISSPGQLDAYLAKLEEKVMPGISIEKAGTTVAMRYVRGMAAPRVLLAHGQLPSQVPVEARMKLIQVLELPATRVSRHLPFCDDFFLYACRSGETTLQGETARNQIARFARSGGADVVAPAAQ